MSIRYERGVLVTPSDAKKWLALNVEHNRRPKSSRIPSYARDMLAGNWHFTGETIKFDTNGNLIDGQNRLMAVIMADVSVLFDVAYNVPPESMLVMDTGSARTFGDTLAITHSIHRNAIASVVRWAMLWETGRYTGSGSPSPTHAEMMHRYKQEMEAFDTASQRGVDVQKQGLASVRPVGTAFYLFAKIDQEQAHVFFDRFVSGTQLVDDHPVLSLRKRLIKDRGQLKAPFVLGLCVRAWNAFREDRLLPQIIVVKGPKLTNENFPKPR